MTTDARRSAVELVVLLTSAGGLDALSIVLRIYQRSFRLPWWSSNTSQAPAVSCRPS
jgi:hypothetical protein